MADVTPLRQNIPLPGSQALGAVSENLIQSLAGTMNFINYFQHGKKEFPLNGPYSGAALPQTGVDGLQVFEFKSQILDVWMYNLVAGTSGTTELDVLVASAPGGTFSSIFTTTPKISWQAGNNVWVGVPNASLVGQQYTPPAYSAPANTTPPVLNAAVTNSIAAWSAIRADLKQAQAGGQNCGIIIHFRPIS